MLLVQGRQEKLNFDLILRHHHWFWGLTPRLIPLRPGSVFSYVYDQIFRDRLVIQINFWEEKGHFLVDQETEMDQHEVSSTD